MTLLANLQLRAVLLRRRCWRAPAVQQSIDVSWPPGPQQQTRRTLLQRSIAGTDRRTDIVQLHRPCRVQVAAVLTVNACIAAATYRITLAHAGYSLHLRVDSDLAPRLPLSLGDLDPPNTWFIWTSEPRPQTTYRPVSHSSWLCPKDRQTDTQTDTHTDHGTSLTK